MKVFYESNLAKWLLWQGYSTITLGCFVFTKKTKEEMKQRVLNHEAIHVRQWEECMIASAILLTLVMFLTEFSVWIYLLCLVVLSAVRIGICRFSCLPFFQRCTWSGWEQNIVWEFSVRNGGKIQ